MNAGTCSSAACLRVLSKHWVASVGHPAPGLHVADSGAVAGSGPTMGGASRLFTVAIFGSSRQPALRRATRLGFCTRAFQRRERFGGSSPICGCLFGPQRQDGAGPTHMRASTSWAEAMGRLAERWRPCERMRLSPKRKGRPLPGLLVGGSPHPAQSDGGQFRQSMERPAKSSPAWHLGPKHRGQRLGVVGNGKEIACLGIQLASFIIEFGRACSPIRACSWSRLSPFLRTRWKC